MWRAIEGWEREGEVTVERGGAFWEAVLGRKVLKGVYVRGEKTYIEMLSTVKEFADGLCVFFSLSPFFLENDGEAHPIGSRSSALLLPFPERWTSNGTSRRVKGRVLGN
jgi:mRNA deadenylase 3'-5' endonuclease subunit Ccr4